MKTLGLILVGMLLLAVGAVHAADLQKGVAAYERRDYAAAIVEFRPLAEQGNAFAQYSLGRIYDEGEGVPQDYGQAIAWYRKAAEQGLVEAQFNLGSMYFAGHGAPQDYAQAIAWFRKAAEQGGATPQYILGRMYESGQGVPQDYGQAIVWYRKAAEQGMPDAQYSLGSMYDQGEGVLQDYVQALAWYRKAAEQGSANAQELLGLFYVTGRGVPKDFVASYALFNLAASHDNSSQNFAANDRNKLLGLLSPAQVEAGQALTREMRRVGVLKALNAHPLPALRSQGGASVAQYRVPPEASDVRVKQPIAGEADAVYPAINDATATAGNKMSATLLFVLYLIEAYCGVAMMMYRSAASVCNWSVGRWYIGKDDRSFSPMAIFGAAVYTDAVIWALIRFGWKGALGIAVLAYFVNYPVSAVLRWRVQILCPMAALVCAGIALFVL